VRRRVRVSGRRCGSGVYILTGSKGHEREICLEASWSSWQIPKLRIGMPE
jgi:hypothetical protein